MASLGEGAAATLHVALFKVSIAAPPPTVVVVYELTATHHPLTGQDNAFAVLVVFGDEASLGDDRADVTHEFDDDEAPCAPETLARTPSGATTSAIMERHR